MYLNRKLVHLKRNWKDLTVKDSSVRLLTFTIDKNFFEWAESTSWINLNVLSAWVELNVINANNDLTQKIDHKLDNTEIKGLSEICSRSVILDIKMMYFAFTVNFTVNKFQKLFSYLQR